MKLLSLRTMLVACSLTLLSTGVNAQSITLSTPNADGVFATAGWSDLGGGFSITSTYTNNLTHYTYDYHITADPSGSLSKGISHIILQMSPNVPIHELVIPGSLEAKYFDGQGMSSIHLLQDGDAPKTYQTGSNSNPGLPNPIYGIKWDMPDEDSWGDEIDVRQLWFSFDSLRLPILGDFYAKDGKDPRTKENVYAYNTHLASGGPCTESNCIWVPDSESVTVIPEPSTYAIMGSLLLVVMIAARRRAVKSC